MNTIIKKVLIVDDEPHVLKELPKAFSKHFSDREVHTAHSFEIAEKLIQQNNYEIITLDGMLSDSITDPPEHGFGYNLIPLIKEKSDDTVIIMISTDGDYRDIGEKLGAHFKISKNFFFKNARVVGYLQPDFTVD